MAIQTLGGGGPWVKRYSVNRLVFRIWGRGCKKKIGCRAGGCGRGRS